MLLTLAGALAIAWLVVVAVVVGLCVDAARSDRERASAQTLPLRSTWRTVRSSSLRSAHSDQFAT